MIWHYTVWHLLLGVQCGHLLLGVQCGHLLCAYPVPCRNPFTGAIIYRPVPFYDVTNWILDDDDSQEMPLMVAPVPDSDDDDPGVLQEDSFS